MPTFPLAVQSSRRGDDPGASSERLINVYPQPGAERSRSGFVLRSVLGLTTKADLGVTITRAIHAANGCLWVAGSGALYEIDGTTFAVNNRGAITDSADTFFSANGTNITLCAGGTYYVWDGAALTTPTGGRITTESTVDFASGYTLLTDSTSGEFEWTDLNLPKTRNALYFATAESQNDNLRRVVVNGREVWLFGAESTEVWYNTGQAGALAFKRLPGAAIPEGVLAASLAVPIGGRVFFVNHLGVVNQTEGLSFAPISTPPVEVATRESTPTHAFAYSDEGHTFFCVRFSDRPAWVFDLKTRRWHERASGVDWHEWEVIGTAQLNGKWYGVNTLGKIYEMGRTNDDAGNELVRVIQSPAAYAEGEYISVTRFELLGEIGTSDIGRDVTVALQISRDGGFAWEPQLFRSFGTQGEYRKRAVWGALGGGEQLSARLVCSDPADVNIYSNANVEYG